MISKILSFFADPTDAKTFTAIVAGVVATVLGHDHMSNSIIAAIDGGVSLIVAIDVFQTHKSAQQEAALAHDTVKTTIAAKAAAASSSAPSAPAPPAAPAA